MKLPILLLSVLSGNALAEVAAYGQCGGGAWTGETTCVKGYVCKSWGEWYSQCIVDEGGAGATTAASTAPGTLTTMKTSTRAATSTVATKTTTVSATATPTRTPGTGKLQWLGVDESVAEFGEGNYPGTFGVHFRFPDENAISVRSPNHNDSRPRLIMT